MSVVTRNLGRVIGPQGPTGAAGTYNLTNQDKEDIADIVGTDNYIKKGVIWIDVYNSTSSQYPTVVDYIPATYTITDQNNNVMMTGNTNSQRVIANLLPYQRYTIAVSANGFAAAQSQTITTSPTSATTVSFSMTPTAEVYYDIVFKNGDTILYSQRVLPHASCSYVGDEPTQTGSYFTGWDKTVTDAIANTVVNALFLTPVLPAESKKESMSDYDYAYSDDTVNYTSAYTLAEMVGIMTLAADPSVYINIGNEILFTQNLSSTYFDEAISFTLVSFKHYQYADESGNWAKTSWLSGPVLKANHNMNNANTNVGGWASCGMNTWLNGTFFDFLPPILKKIIKPVLVGSSDGDQRQTVTFSSSKLYLPSYSEVGFGTGAPYGDEVATGANEVKFSIFNSNADRQKKRWTRTTTNWWLRSPITGNTASFWCVNSSGSSSNNGATGALGVGAGFSI